ncbi:fungal-specific transcription factor domain-containing protein [Mycena metata]|uniref:Fungal-specific transcription factor domain-containing protein n=1 Tax=Mycena metata TaxID=1033252 RepID=A0AAD7IRD5_9AGAR|nr:fungal-specific transcription factor domain-containing protein [Mycena metata]
MSSDGDHEPMEKQAGTQKRRRLQRSCDNCRRRKIRCDSATMPDGRCTSCIQFQAQCTHTEPTRKRGPKNKHLEELKHQLAVLEAKLSTTSSNGAGAGQAPAISVIQYATSPKDASPSPPSLPEEDLSHDELAQRFRQFSIGALKHRFFGSSSGFMLVKNAIQVKEEYLGRVITPTFRRAEFWNMRPVRAFGRFSAPKFEFTSQWENKPEDERPRYIFPDRDLLTSLINLYFLYIAPTLPLLHRPTFERLVAEGYHLTDPRFGATVLAVLAVASRCSDDPRVFVPGFNSTLSSGWTFFNQIQVVKKSLFDEPSIHEVQTYCLITLYTLGTSSPQASWLYLGLGIRFIQERGEHRRKRDGHKLTAEDELWKRAFWCLLSIDRTICSFLGRSSAIHVEDYDVELPLEVDDEYWEHPDPEMAFRQPAGKPSVLTYFVCHIRLCEILGSTLRRLYASNKSRVLMGLVGPEWEQRAVSELDSAMNEFLGSLPDHLRWDPNRTGIFFDQSAILHAMYYQLQITIHRPYIHKPSILAFSSLAICTSAARSAIHVSDVWLNRMQTIGPPLLQIGTFMSAVILLLNLFGVKRAGLPIDVGKELAHVSTAMRILRFHEARWQSAGRLWELLQELQSWDGPPPAKYSAEPKAPAPPTTGRQAADMCPLTTKTYEEADEASMFTQQPVEVLERAPEIQFGAVANELSSQPNTTSRPAMNLWADMFASDSNNNTGQMTAEQAAGMTMEQLLAATAVYDNATGLAQSADQWSGTTALANMMVDEDILSMWAAAPTTFGNMADWDAYIESRNGPINWSTNFDPSLTQSTAPPP